VGGDVLQFDLFLQPEFMLRTTMFYSRLWFRFVDGCVQCGIERFELLDFLGNRRWIFWNGWLYAFNA